MSTGYNMDDEIFRFFYTMSMRDAVMQKAFGGERSFLWTNPDSKLLDDTLKVFVDSVLMGDFKKQEDYDDAFLKVAHECCDCINKDKRVGGSFTFGNAQKLINMLLKYFYSVCYGKEGMRDCFAFCHCPMDRIMLGKVWEEYNRGIRNALGNRAVFTDAWSREPFGGERYNKFQEAVRTLANKKQLYPIEYDYIAWRDNREVENQ